MRHLIDPLDFSQEEITSLLDLADRIRSDPAAYQDVAAHKKLATLFYEPSTRTRLSFESAMLALGGSVLGFSEAMSSSTAKGETVGDTIHTVSCYADIIAMRHPKEGAPYAASQFSEVPIINAGDGGHLHPTQTLADMITILRMRGSADDMKIGLCGDLKYGRTVHSLLHFLQRYHNVQFYLIAPDALKLPDYMVKFLKDNNMPFCEVDSIDEVLPELDVLYMTRIQQERFFNEEEYLRLKGCYQLDEAMLRLAPADMPVLHPLPRIDEISTDVDNDPAPPTLIRCTTVSTSAWPSFWLCWASRTRSPARPCWTTEYNQKTGPRTTVKKPSGGLFCVLGWIGSPCCHPGGQQHQTIPRALGLLVKPARGRNKRGLASAQNCAIIVAPTTM